MMADRLGVRPSHVDFSKAKGNDSLELNEQGNVGSAEEASGEP